MTLQYCPDWPEDVRPQEKLVFSPHWYDLNALFNKSFGFMTVNVQGLARVGRDLDLARHSPAYRFTCDRECLSARLFTLVTRRHGIITRFRLAISSRRPGRSSERCRLSLGKREYPWISSVCSATFMSHINGKLIWENILAVKKRLSSLGISGRKRRWWTVY